MTEGDPGAEQPLQFAPRFLANYWSGHPTAWMHDMFGSDFRQGAVHALTGHRAKCVA
jgi:hypothetical protein